MYPSTPAFWDGGSRTSAFSALLNGIESCIRSGWCSLSMCGDGSSSGSQCGQCSRSLARSNIVSEPFENSLGAGDDPKGSRVSIDAMNCLNILPSLSISFVSHAAMHLDAIRGVV